MLECLVQILVHDQATQVRVAHVLDERIAVLAVDAVGTGSRNLVGHCVLPDHEHSGVLHGVLVPHQFNVCTLQLLCRC